jgi:uncharacterized membrane protein
MATATIDKSVDVNRSRREAFETLSRIDFFARFPGIEETVRGPSSAHVAETVEGMREEFDVELNTVPDERIEYRIMDGAPMNSTITLQQLDEQHTRLQFHAEYDPEQVSEAYHLSQQEIDQHLQERLQKIKSLVEGD